jgi:hypothetical protein
MRSLSLVPLFLLAACGSGETSTLQGNGAAAPPLGQPDNRIDCRPAGAATFERACTVETTNTPRGPIWTIRKADGGFRRLLQDGDNFVAADGAQPAHVTHPRDGGVEVEIGGDRFRFELVWQATPVNELQAR